MSVLADRVATYLSSLGYGLVGQTIFIDTMPTTPSNCLSVIRNAGPIDPKSPVRQIRFQLLLRNTHSNSAASLANSLNTLLLDTWNSIGCYPGRCVAEREIGPPIRDPNNMTVYSLNYTVTTTSLR